MLATGCRVCSGAAEYTAAMTVLVRDDWWGMGVVILRVAPIACSHNLVLFRWKVARGLEMSGRCWYSK